MNDFLKDLIKSVAKLETASGFEAVMILDDIQRDYNEHISSLTLKENDVLKSELCLTQSQLGQALKDVEYLKGKLNAKNRLEWKKSLSDIGSHIEESENTLLHCRIEEMTIGYKVTCLETLSQITHVNSCESIEKCKHIAEVKFFEMINRKIY